jgi:hypothetical protein
VCIPIEVFERVRAESVRTGRSYSQIVVDALDKTLS